MSSHPDVVELVDYSRGTLAADRSRRLRDHCTACVECGDQLAALLLLQQPEPRVAMQHRAVSEVAVLHGAVSRVAVLAVAATLAAIAIGLWAGPSGSQLAAPVPAAPGHEPLEYLQAPLAVLLWAVDVDMGAAAPTPVAAADRPAVVALEGAVAALRVGDYSGAAVAATRTGGDLAALLRGVALLHAGQAGAAREPLTRALSRFDADQESSVYAHAARLYLAEALLRLGELHAAHLQLQALAGSSEGRDPFERAAAIRLAGLGALPPR